MIHRVLETAFSNRFSLENFQDFIRELFHFSDFVSEEIPLTQQEQKYFKKFTLIAKLELENSKKLDVLVVENQSQNLRARTQQKNLIIGHLKENNLPAALVCFYFPEADHWRFSFVKLAYEITEKRLQESTTPAKRYSFLLETSPKSQNRTAKTRLQELFDLAEPLTMEKLEEAFSVEKVNKDFYKELFEWYKKAQEKVQFPNEEGLENSKEQALIRLITRLIFVWFLGKQGLVPEKLFQQEEVKNLIHYKEPSSYYKAILQNLFFATLNREINERKFRSYENFHGKTKDYGVTNLFRYKDLFKIEEKKIIQLFQKTPFLNGGLFEALDRYTTEKEEENFDKKARVQKHRFLTDAFAENYKNLKVPNELFFSSAKDGIINIFQKYQFTAEETTPLDQDISLNPELLGRVFENLLASYNPETGETVRKMTGSFYTPSNIVSYIVETSLYEYFLQETKTKKEKIAALFIEGAEAENLTQEEKEQLVASIGKLTILDPAVGSGAFPMGILQKLTELLEKLDPQNKLWKAKQIATIEKTLDPISREKALASVEENFTKENHYGNYGRKLYLIQKVIYGVDIQPIAIQICKLRFFLSLLIEQKPRKDSKNNYGFKPLPNLETNFITADSLLSLEGKTKQVVLETSEVIEIKKGFKKNKENYFTASSREEKKKYEKENKNLRQRLAKELQVCGFKKSSADKIASWDIYNQIAPVPDWFDCEYMLGKKDFCLVLGNPPYIQLQKMTKMLARRYQDLRFQTYARSGDIYCLFYEKALILSKKNKGIVAFITSNKWMRADYGEQLRKFFSHHQPLYLIDFAGYKVFKNATVDPNILLLKNKHLEKNHLQATAIKEDFKGEDLTNYTKKNSVTLKELGSEAWFVGSEVEINLKKKIEKIGKPLGEWDVKINYGIKTGYNEAFIIGEEKREEILASCKLKEEREKTEQIIKPILRGRDIERYSYQWAGLYLIATHNGYKQNNKKIPAINITDYPAVRKHLKQFYSSLKKRQDKGKTPYNLRNCAYYPDFEREKIVWTAVNSEYKFTLLPSKLYFNNSIFMIISNKLIYLCAIFNSKICRNYISFLLASEEEYNYGSKMILTKIPIPPITPENKNTAQKIEKLAEEVLKAKKQNKPTEEMEQQIDNLVYELYHLTKDEISLVESQNNP